MEQNRTFAVFLGQNKNDSASGFVVENDFFIALEIEDTDAQNQIKTTTADLQEVLKTKTISTTTELKQIAELFLQNYRLSSLAIGYFSKNHIYTFSQNAAVLLLRQNRLYLASQENQALSGNYNFQDCFLLGTKSIAPLLTKTPNKPLTQKEPKALIDEFKTQHSPNYGVLLIVQITHEPNIDKPVPTIPHSQSRPFLLKKTTLSKTKWIKLIGIGFILLLILWQGFVFLNQTLNQQRAKIFNQRLLTLSGNYEQLKKKLQKNPISAVEQINNLNQQLDQFISRYPTKTEEYHQLKQKIKALSSTYGSAQVSKETVFFDLALINKQATADYLSLTENYATLLDKKNQRVYLVNITDKNIQDFGFKKDLRPTLATEYNQTAYLFDVQKGVYKEEDEKFINIIKPESNWGKIVDLKIFNNNIYLLSSDKDEIFKFTPTENGYSSALSYFQAGQSLDLQAARNLSIDFSVYLLANRIYKFTSGTNENFHNPAQLDFQGITQIYKNPKTKFIYLLDQAESRIIALNENGEIVKSIFNPLLVNCRYFGVFQDEIIIFLHQNKLFKLDNF